MISRYSILLYISLCVFAFVFPFSSLEIPYTNFAPSLLAFSLLIWILGNVLENNFAYKFKQIRSNKAFFPFVICTGLYFLYVIGLLYSDNLSFGLDDIFLKLPMLLFPLIIFFTDLKLWTKKRVFNLLKLFIAGNLIALIASIIHSWVLYLDYPFFRQFHYTNASWFHHPSYASMYYCFSFAIIVYYLLNEKTKRWEKIAGSIAIILFSAEIILLDSRAGILAFGCVLLTYGLYIILFKRHLLFKVLLIVLCATTALTGTYKLLPNEINRIKLTVRDIDKETFSTSDPEKANVRILIWNATTKVAIKNLPFGVGTGDIKDELLKQYAEEGYNEPYEERHNAHCQYLQIFATLGIAGILLFLMIIILPFWIGYTKRNILYLIFGIIISVNLVVESMFEKQVGIMFFCFFFPLMFIIAQNKLLKENTSVEK